LDVYLYRMLRQTMVLMTSSIITTQCWPTSRLCQSTITYVVFLNGTLFIKITDTFIFTLPFHPWRNVNLRSIYFVHYYFHCYPLCSLLFSIFQFHLFFCILMCILINFFFWGIYFYFVQEAKTWIPKD
jgi:hypothetical protein